jgi:hypothetical protein
MSSGSVGLGNSKKGRVADSSMVTRNIKIVAQGQADATYADQQKKNGFRLSTAILNGGGSYSAQTLVRKNIENAPAAPPPEPGPEPPEPEPEPPTGTVDLFSPFNVADWQLNNDYSSESTDPPGITMMTASPFIPNSGSPRSSSFYTKYILDLTRPFMITATFLTRTTRGASGSPPLDGFTVAISASPLAFGGNGGNLGIGGGGNTFPVVGIALKPLSSNNTFLARANTTLVPNGLPASLGSIGNDITTVNDLTIIVNITYTLADEGTLEWDIIDSEENTASNTYTGVSFPTLLEVNRGYVGCSAGAGIAIQPVFLIGMTMTQ